MIKFQYNFQRKKTRSFKGKAFPAKKGPDSILFIKSGRMEGFESFGNYSE